FESHHRHQKTGSALLRRFHFLRVVGENPPAQVGRKCGPFWSGKKGEGLAERGKILHYLRVPPPAPKNGIGAFAPVPFFHFADETWGNDLFVV
ncbi:MAG: hypothetical protein LKJ73_03660, partial [Oscillospiraceae bacterium]|nr:hypothetical protein [Oscillospiraceae bacterium]